MTYRVMVHHEGVDKTGRPLSAGDASYIGGDDTRVFYDRAEAESAFESFWATFRSGNPRADHSQMNFTKVNTNNLRELERLIKTENRNTNNNSNNLILLKEILRLKYNSLIVKKIR